MSGKNVASSSVQQRQEFDELLSTLACTELTFTDNSKEWNDDVIPNSKKYNIYSYPNSTLLKLAKGLRKGLSDTGFDQWMGLRILILASHIFDTKSGSQKLLLVNFFPNGQGEFPTSSFSQTLELERAKLVADRNAEEIRAFFMHQSELKYMTFVAAYLLRFLMKAESNIRDCWTNMNARFRGFYGLRNFQEVAAPSENWIGCLKSTFSYDRLIGNTWIHMIVQAEENFGSNSVEMGLIRFLAINPLSFSGMLPYKLFLEVLDVSRIQPSWLLKGMMCPHTRDAILCIDKILKNETKKVGFKYARVISSDYFQEIQTKRCPAFLFLQVEIIKQFRNFAGTNYDPSGIVGLQSLSTYMKTSLRRFAKILVENGPLVAGEESKHDEAVAMCQYPIPQMQQHP